MGIIEYMEGLRMPTTLNHKDPQLLLLPAET